MSLLNKGKITLKTQLGTSEVQLLLGDITQLPVEEKVDIMFVSAFPGDYTPVPGTLIGELKRNLDLVIRDVAKKKELDLRKSFNCWVSKPLPSSLPYGRIVCFERMTRSETLAEQISGLFRAMMPIFSNKSTSVITPLLATGNQGNSEVAVLKSIVTAACHWIKAGLPLSCLKIVVYAKNPHSGAKYRSDLIECFSKLKTKWEEKKLEEVSKLKKTYDVCFSFSNEDENAVSDISQSLRKAYTGVVIHTERLIYNHEEVWQEKIFDVMVHSRRIVAVLTPSYVGKSECLEQFNLALCCNRLTGAEVLAPFYLQTVDSLPSYMTLIQYTECRVRKEGEKKEEKIFSACQMLTKAMVEEKSSLLSSPSDCGDGTATEAKSVPSSSTTYDIFISYAHKTPVEANKLYTNLLEIDPDLKVFLDRSELRTGNSWQETLYEAVDKARVVVAFFTPSYVQSTVCQEEYNIALARYLSNDGIYFLPLLVDTAMTELPALFSGAPVVDMSNLSKRFEEQYHRLAQVPIQWLEALDKGSPIMNKFCQPEPMKKRISFVTVKWRERDFDERFSYKENNCIQLKDKLEQTTGAEGQSPKKVVVSFAEDCFKQAALLSHYLGQGQGEGGGVSVQFLSGQQSGSAQVQAPKLQLLDTADMVVVIVSDDYLDSTQHLHELHIALCRQRTVKDQRVVYLIQGSHHKRRPVYPHLLPYSVSLGDELWESMSRKLRHPPVPITVTLPGTSDTMIVRCTALEMEALSVAALDIAHQLRIGNQKGDSGVPTNIVNLVQLMGHVKGAVPMSQCLVPFSILLESGEDAFEDVADALPDPPSHTPGDPADGKDTVSHTPGDTADGKDTVSHTPGDPADGKDTVSHTPGESKRSIEGNPHEKSETDRQAVPNPEQFKGTAEGNPHEKSETQKENEKGKKSSRSCLLM